MPEPFRTTEPIERWRLILGKDAESAGGEFEQQLGAESADVDRVLEYLFDREYAQTPKIAHNRDSGSGASTLTIPDWLGRVRDLFPRSTSEELARLALDRYGLVELLADESFLEKTPPSMDLLRAVLACKDMIPRHVLKTARRIVREVAEQLRKRFETQIAKHFAGTRSRRRSLIPLAKNFDVKTTIRRNLKHFQRDRKELLIERPFFYSRIRRQTPWDLILLVDQSGSMADSVIHAAVMAGIFHSLALVRTKLVLFDTSIVDLSNDVGDPVEMLMRVQLGGGTDIAAAVAYGSGLVRNPHKTIVVLITDFFEGGSVADLLSQTSQLVESGATLLGLAALDDRAEPAYDRSLAKKLAKLGMHIAAMTPDRLAEWVAQRVRNQ